MIVHVNDEPRDVPEGTSIAELLARLDVNRGHVAVEVNFEIVPRAMHGERILAAGDRLEVVTLVGGG